jgi:integrase
VFQILIRLNSRSSGSSAAEWAHFSLGEGVWVKPSHHTKTKIRQTLYLASTVVALLREMRMADPSGKFLFVGQTGKKPRTDLKRPWEAILAAADLKGFRLHDLRRTNASFMLSTGSDLSTVGKALLWADRGD